MDTIEAVIDRAAADPDFLARLAKDPHATAQEEGLEISDEDLRSYLGVDSSDEDLAEALQARLSHSPINNSDESFRG